MPVLREIVARLGIDLDKKGFADANKRVGQTVKQLKETPAAANAALASVTRFFGAAAIGFGALKIIELASDVNETINLLDASFEGNSAAVQRWASDFSESSGRSEFAMREMAGVLGAVLNPLLDKNADKAAEMSTKMAALAVDLGSFFNTADDVVLQNLRSGFTGGTEAMFKYGVVMTDVNLQQFALAQGINKTVKSMDVAEKTALKYEFILDKTALAMGDAARTSEGWANASKGLLAGLKDLATRIGLTVLPFAEKIIIVSRNAVRAFVEWQKGTRLLEAGLIVLGLIGAKVALGLLIAWAPVIVPMLKFIAVVAIAALILDDFLVFMSRGDSVIGRFIDSIFGPGSAAAAVDHLFEAWDKMNFFWSDTVIPMMTNVGVAMADAMIAARGAFTAFFADVGVAFNAWWSLVQKRVELVKRAFKALTSFGFDLGVSTAAGESGNEFKERRRRRAAAASGRVPVPAAAAVLQSLPGQNMSIDNSITVAVAGNATAADAARIADASAQAQRSQARRTKAAVTQRTEG